jgi:hypothetical protein
MQYFESAGRSKLKGTFIVSSVEVEPSNTPGGHRFTMSGLRRGERGVLFAKTSSAASLQAWISFMKGLKEAEEMARRDAAELSVENLKKLLCDENVNHDDCDCLQQSELAARLVEHQTNTGKQLAREGHDSLQLVLTCMVMGCLNAIDETVCGSGYCAEHEHHPVSKASFEVVRQVLIDIRESTGYAGWETWHKKGWDTLETYTAMEQLGQETYKGVNMVTLKDGELVGIHLDRCNLTGIPPPCLGAHRPLNTQHVTAAAFVVGVFVQARSRLLSPSLTLSRA